MSWRPQQAFLTWAGNIFLRPGVAQPSKPSEPNPEPQYMYCYEVKGGRSTTSYYRCYLTVSDAVAGTGPVKNYPTLPTGALEVPRP